MGGPVPAQPYKVAKIANSLEVCLGTGDLAVTSSTYAHGDRRIDNVMQFGKLRGQIEGVFKNLDRFNPLKA